VIFIATMVMMVGMAGSVWSAWRLERLRPNATLRDVMYIQSPRTVRYLSLGYSGLAADIYWTRAVQYFGGKHHEHSMEYQLLYPMLNLTAGLDPHLVVAYEFGSFFLAQKPPEGAGSPDLAAEFVERGIQANPKEWRLYYHLGFIQSIERKDYAAAAEAFRKGSEVPGALPWMKVMAAAMSQRGGDRETSRYLWSRIYESSDDKQIKQNAFLRLVAMQMEDEITAIEQRVAQYEAATKLIPQSWQQLIQAGFLRGVPADPSGQPYLLSQGRVQVADPQRFPFLTKGLPPGQKPEEIVTDKAFKPKA
jgi:hypothetical protein